MPWRVGLILTNPPHGTDVPAWQNKTQKTRPSKRKNKDHSTLKRTWNRCLSNNQKLVSILHGLEAKWITGKSKENAPTQIAMFVASEFEPQITFSNARISLYVICIVQWKFPYSLFLLKFPVLQFILGHEECKGKRRRKKSHYWLRPLRHNLSVIRCEDGGYWNPVTDKQFKPTT